MSRYSMRLRIKRTYELEGRQIGTDRKLKRHFYNTLKIKVDGRPEDAVVNVGDYIIIESDDDDNPYVAQLLKLFCDETRKVKKALVQWYVHYCEVPKNKKKLLGRAPHPQEIFYYNDPSCDSEVDAETILGKVEVKHIKVEAPFPETQTNNTLYVKLSWDTKTFKAIDMGLTKPWDTVTTPPKQGTQSPVVESPKSPPPSASSQRGPALRALPTPDPTVMRRASSTSSYTSRTMSTGKIRSREAESIHSASKLSASKLLSEKRRGRATSGPAVRKKLELSSPGKLIEEEMLSKLMDEELAKKVSSPTKTIELSISLVPLMDPRKSRRQEDEEEEAFPLEPLQSPDQPTAATLDSQDTTRDLHGPSDDEFVEEGVTRISAKTPQRKATPRRSNLRGPSRTPSRRKDLSSAFREPSLGVLEEAEHEHSPAEPAATPRSKRKSAQLVSGKILKQLDLLNDQEVDSDGGEEDLFVPSKIDLQSSSDEDGMNGSDDELVSRKSRRVSSSQTPRSTDKRRSSTRTPRKTPSKKAPPPAARTPRRATPSIPTRTLPARNPDNVLEEARARLHVSSVPESLPCREQEFQDIYNFVESKVIDGTGGCMYISGVPGTGKTATVHEVIRCLQQSAVQDEIPHFHFIEINGMKMTDPHQAYVQILQKLSNQKATADHAASLLEKRFSNPAPKKETTVLLVDELDLLWTRKQNVMYNLFDWPTRRHARLVVLTIANTMDLPERIMINRVASRLGLTRMSFQPYTFKQLQQIITSRLNRVKAFEEDALQLVSRKVAALSGDARRCLDICRRATEICEFSGGKQNGARLVGMSHVMEVLNEMFSSSYVTAIRCSSVQEQLFLRAVIAEFRRLGLEEATFQQVFVQHQALCRVEGLQPICVSEGLAVCQRLGACRLLLLEPSGLDLLLRVRLNVSQDDVLYALKAD
ncbi:origin recognition complex subunit 1 [Denticeps clupeoides]|uniref:origin recognition complex subunit 1 n=1 Tax=Denticeps clupeoides TaxID=299321 RepID=UPI0010A2E159|nr:origin recognition complex subunit 1 [Denticeps clupeoides]